MALPGNLPTLLLSFIFLGPTALECPMAPASLNGPGFSLSTHCYYEGNDSVLHLDLRLPDHPLTDAPGLIFVHGGGFSSGSRDQGAQMEMLDRLAESGIISASISYTLSMKERGFGCDVPSSDKQAAVERAARELVVARDWLESSGLPVPREWVAMGSSAGAETALWAGYGMGNRSWAGIVSLSGALGDTVSLPAAPPPLFAVHGQCDAVVPPGKDLHRGCASSDLGAWSLCGGPCLADRLRNGGHPAWSVTWCGGEHGVCNAAMKDPLVHLALFNWLTSDEIRASSAVKLCMQGAMDWSDGQACPSSCP